MTPREEIEALIGRVALGDRRAFQRLYDRTSAKLFGICLRVLNDRAVAEEVLQEVYLRIWDKAGLYRANGYSPMTWLITLARNASIDRRRKLAARGGAAGLDQAETVPDAAPGPAAILEAGDEARVLQGCLDALPEGRADMIRRVYLDGLSYSELAAATQTKLNTVRTWLRRSLMQLRECLSQ